MKGAGKIYWVLLLIFSLFASETGYSQSTNLKTECKYKIGLSFEPEENKLSGKVKIIHPSDSVFVLAKALKLISVEADGKEVLFTSFTPLDSNSNEYSINFQPEKLIINYSGQIRQEDFPKTISNLNMVTSDLIELSDHIDWYPKLKNYLQPIYHLSIDLPEKFEIVTNCTKITETKNSGRNLTTWESSDVYSITLVAAPELKKSVLSENELTIEIYYKSLPASYTDSMKTDLMKTWNFYENLYGVAGANNNLRVVYSPRTAGGYARAPLIVVSEKYALEQLSAANGYARDFRLNAHEMAHYWSKANPSTPDDWINEGLAEFSALLASEQLIGKDFSDLLVEEYKGIVFNTQTDVSVLETKSDSWEREINRYYKPTLLLNDLKKKYGDSRLKEFFHLLYKKFAESKAANTKLFIDALNETYGHEEAESFLNALSEKNWVKEISTTAIADLDTVIVGTWVGKLTQFGTTTQFVLNVKTTDNEVVATLDSPDQNAFDIPVSEFRFTGENVFFRVGIASATYTGKLKSDRNRIIGIWNQRDVEYILDISKQYKK